MDICPKCGFKPDNNIKEVIKFRLLLADGFEFHPSTIPSFSYKPKVS